MKIVHQVDGMMQVGGGSSGPLIGKKQFNVDLLLCTDPNYNQPWAKEEVIYIEGDAASVLAMLQDAIDSVNLLGDSCVEDNGLDPAWREKRPPKMKRAKKGKKR